MFFLVLWLRQMRLEVVWGLPPLVTSWAVAVWVWSREVTIQRPAQSPTSTDLPVSLSPPTRSCWLGIHPRPPIGKACASLTLGLLASSTWGGSSLPPSVPSLPGGHATVCRSAPGWGRGAPVEGRCMGCCRDLLNVISSRPWRYSVAKLSDTLMSDPLFASPCVTAPGHGK